MIALTFDIHHQSLGTGNQAHSDRSEPQCALDVLQMLEERNLKGTYFLTGKLVEEEGSRLNPIYHAPGLELGGHTYDCFEPSWFHRVWKKIDGSYPGPRWKERRDIRRTLEAIHRASGRICRSWRNHMYLHGPRTKALLAEAGVEVVSDRVTQGDPGPLPSPEGILDLAINVVPDHEHLIHAERTPEWIAWWTQRYGWKDAFGSESVEIEAWGDWVMDVLRQNQSEGHPSVFMLHPITMYLADGYKTLARILGEVKAEETRTVSELSREASSPDHRKGAAA